MVCTLCIILVLSDLYLAQPVVLQTVSQWGLHCFSMFTAVGRNGLAIRELSRRGLPGH